MYPGFCAVCCTCPAPELAVVHRASMKSKCGLYVDKTNSVWVFYLQSVVNTVINQSVSYADIGVTGSPAGGTTLTGNTSATYTMDKTTCATTTVCTGTASASGSTTGYVSYPDYPYDYTCAGSWSYSTCGWVAVSTSGQFYPGTSSNPASPTLCSFVPPGEVVDSGFTSPPVYSVVYSTSDLQSAVVSALPAWGSFPPFGGAGGAEIASSELSSDESSYSIMDGRYQWAHPVPPGGTYKLAWDEQFTPDDGGAVINTHQSYTWDGTHPSGYNSGNSATWPKTPVFEVDHPAANGSVFIRNLTVDCGGGPVTLFS